MHSICVIFQACVAWAKATKGPLRSVLEAIDTYLIELPFSLPGSRSVKSSTRTEQAASTNGKLGLSIDIFRRRTCALPRLPFGTPGKSFKEAFSQALGKDDVRRTG